MPDTATEFEFGDGEYRFWLPLPQAIELERKCGIKDDAGKLHPKSLYAIFEQLGEGLGRDPASGTLHWLGGGAALVSDANEVLRLGLIGGNQGPVENGSAEVGPLRAKRLVELYGYPARPMNEVVANAWRVLHAAIVGVAVKKKDEPSEKVKPRRRSKKAPASPTAGN